MGAVLVNPRGILGGVERYQGATVGILRAIA